MRYIFQRSKLIGPSSSPLSTIAGYRIQQRLCSNQILCSSASPFQPCNTIFKRKEQTSWNHLQYHPHTSYSTSTSSLSSSSSRKSSSSNDNGTPRMEVWEIPVAGGNDVDNGTHSKDEKGAGGTLYYEYTPQAKDGKSKEQHSWKSTKVTPQKEATNALSPMNILKTKNTIQDHLLKHFLPTDYPQSVDKGYKEFVSYCFLSNICGSAAMVLSTQTLLLAVGVGSASSAPMAGALNWVMKDGIGQLGGVLFASRITSNITGNTIDKDPKRWRMVSAISMDGATLLEICSPLFPGYFLAVASIANIGKNIGFLTASASRAALHQSLAIRDNLGDVTAKAGSQSIAASLLGTGLGIALSPLIGEDYMYITIGFICLSSIHQFCTYQSLKAVALKKFNRHRLLIALDLFLQNNTGKSSSSSLSSLSMTKNKKVNVLNEYSFITPEVVSKYESFIPFFHPDNSHTWLQIGTSLKNVAPTPQIFHHLTQECLLVKSTNSNHNKKEKYIINCTIEKNDGEDDITSLPPTTSLNVAKVMLTFHHDATDMDIIRGMFHAYVLYTCPLNEWTTNDDIYDKRKSEDVEFDNDDAVKFHSIAASHQFMDDHCDLFLSKIEKWWEMKENLINVESSSSYRIRVDVTK